MESARAVARTHPVNSWRQAERSDRAQATEFRTNTQRAAEITITTAEGDKITLSLAAQDSHHTASYRARGRGEADGQRTERISGREQQSTSAAQVNIAIEGNLSNRETADIQKLLSAFGQAIQGDASGLAQFGSLESLATANLSYSYSQQTQYTKVDLYA